DVDLANRSKNMGYWFGAFWELGIWYRYRLLSIYLVLWHYRFFGIRIPIYILDGYIYSSESDILAFIYVFDGLNIPNLDKGFDRHIFNIRFVFLLRSFCR